MITHGIVLTKIVPIIETGLNFLFDTIDTRVISAYTVHVIRSTVGRGDCLHIVISNSSDLPIYAQIKEQVKEQILSGELEEDEMLPSLRQLARDYYTSIQRIGRRRLYYKSSR